MFIVFDSVAIDGDDVGVQQPVGVVEGEPVGEPVSNIVMYSLLVARSEFPIY